ncbi:MAG: hypothetical protein U1C66_00050, partial [Patescibacteria group bacterium]|nr:hypothetical protein [Patescibacteria group bacterium]
MADIDAAEKETAATAQGIVDLFIARDASMGLIFSSLLTVLLSALTLGEAHKLISSEEAQQLRAEMARAIEHPPTGNGENSKK